MARSGNALAIALGLLLILQLYSGINIPFRVHANSGQGDSSEVHAFTKSKHITASPYAEINVRSLPPPEPTHRLNVMPYPVANLTAFKIAKSEAEKVGLQILKPLANVQNVTPPGFSIVNSFEGLPEFDVPPDVSLAVGPNHIVESINSLMAIWNKQGIFLQSIDLHNFFNVFPNSFLSDPKVLFDATSGRWFATEIDVNNGAVLLAVSTTNNPTGSWFLFELSAASGNGEIPDQPHIGISDDKFVISANDFTPNGQTPIHFLGAQIWILNKASLISGFISGVTAGPPNVFLRAGIHPVQSLSPTTTQYMVGVDLTTSSIVHLFNVTGSAEMPNVGLTDLHVATISLPPKAVQFGTNSFLDTEDNRVQDGKWFMGKLWLTLSDACIPSGDTQSRSCIRMIQIDTTTNTLKQDFDVPSTGRYLFYPALGTDNKGDLLAIFGFSSINEFPGLLVTGQAVRDAPDSIRIMQLLKAGSAPATNPRCAEQTLQFGGCRYGDYFGAAVDPSDPTLVWVAGEYGSNFPAVDNETARTFIGVVRFNTAANIPPIASNLTVSTSKNTAKTVTLTGSDPDGDALTFSIVTGPTHGVLGTVAQISPTSANVTYTPNTNFTGSDSFTFKANDGKVDSNIAKVSIVFGATMQNFALSLNPSAVTITIGTSGIVQASINTLGTTFNSTVMLGTINPLPSNVSLNFSPNPITPAQTSTMTVSVGSIASAGTRVMTVQASGNGLTRMSNLTLTIQVPANQKELTVKSAANALANAPYNFTASMNDAITGVKGLQFDLTFNPTLCKNNTINVQFLQGNFGGKIFNVLQNGAVRIAEFNTSPVINNGPLDLASISCIVENLQSGTIVSIGFANVSFSNVNSTVISGISPLGRELQVVHILKGDLDMDGIVSMNDVVSALRIALGLLPNATSDQKFSADVFPAKNALGNVTPGLCGDGKVTLDDAIVLFDVVLGRNSIPSQCG